MLFELENLLIFPAIYDNLVHLWQTLLRDHIPLEN